MDRCNETQENIAGGVALSVDQQRHAAGSARCTAVAATYSLLDATRETFAPTVPDGVAKRVMARGAADEVVPGPAKRGRGGNSRWFERRPVQLAVAHAAALCAVFNVAWFVVRVFAADVALGGTP